MSYIDVEELRKSFTVRKKREKGSLFREKQKVDALCGVSFQVERGELVGYIGPNGAGKSTTVKILSGILTPDSGTVLVGGMVPWKNRREHVRRIGVVFGQRMQLWWDVPILDSFSLLKDIYRLSDADWKKRLCELSEALQLGDLLRTPLRLLSLGQRMRAELCASLLHSPEILFLDEATSGADPLTRYDFWRRLLDLADKGVAVIITTHFMDEADYCDHMVIMQDGKTVASGSVTEIRRQGTPEGAPLNDITEAFVHIIQKKEAAS